jgi:hypothetical protein
MLDGSAAQRSLEPEDRAIACRAAVLAFYDVDPWSRADLAEWLVTSYAPLVISRRPVEAEPVDCGAPEEWPIRSIVLRTRISVVQQVVQIAAGDDAAPIAHALGQGHVLAGNAGWVAEDAPRMELWERVWSLVAVDYLTNSAAFLEAVHACLGCGSLRASPCECGGRPRYRSGIISRPPEE